MLRNQLIGEEPFCVDLGCFVTIRGLLDVGLELELTFFSIFSLLVLLVEEGLLVVLEAQAGDLVGLNLIEFPLAHKLFSDLRIPWEIDNISQVLAVVLIWVWGGRELHPGNLESHCFVLFLLSWGVLGCVGKHERGFFGLKTIYVDLTEVLLGFCVSDLLVQLTEVLEVPILGDETQTPLEELRVFLSEEEESSDEWFSESLASLDIPVLEDE